MKQPSSKQSLGLGALLASGGLLEAKWLTVQFAVTPPQASTSQKQAGLPTWSAKQASTQHQQQGRVPALLPLVKLALSHFQEPQMNTHAQLALQEHSGTAVWLHVHQLCAAMPLVLSHWQEQLTSAVFALKH